MCRDLGLNVEEARRGGGAPFPLTHTPLPKTCVPALSSTHLAPPTVSTPSNSSLTVRNGGGSGGLWELRGMEEKSAGGAALPQKAC